MTTEEKELLEDRLRKADHIERNLEILNQASRIAAHGINSRDEENVLAHACRICLNDLEVIFDKKIKELKAEYEKL